MTNCDFKVGDRVSDMGRKGTVTRVDPFIHVEFDDGCFSYFLLDGRQERDHTRPSLKKLKKKKARYFPGVWQRIEMKNGVSIMAFVPGVPYVDLIQFDGTSVWLKDCGTKKPKGA